MINICHHGDCTIGKKEICILKIPIKNRGFVLVKLPRWKTENTTKSRKCHDQHSKSEMQSFAPCHDKMWNLVYTSAQLEGEALLIVTLNLKPNNKVTKLLITVHNQH